MDNGLPGILEVVGSNPGVSSLIVFISYNMQRYVLLNRHSVSKCLNQQGLVAQLDNGLSDVLEVVGSNPGCSSLIVLISCNKQRYGLLNRHHVIRYQ